jgi:hypothetical protein
VKRTPKRTERLNHAIFWIFGFFTMVLPLTLINLQCCGVGLVGFLRNVITPFFSCKNTLLREWDRFPTWNQVV